MQDVYLDLEQNPDKYARRQERIHDHYRGRYGNKYSDYARRPVIEVGGGYSSIFWYTLSDWELQRQALWLYHHQNMINHQLMAQRLQNAALKAEIDRLKANGVAIDANYIDAEFRDNQDLMYSDDYVAAIYDQPNYAKFFLYFFCSVLLIALFGFLVWLIFIKDWNFSKS